MISLQDDFLNEHILVVMLRAKAGNKNYLSILEYFLSANGSVTGSSCRISKKSSLFLDVSPWPSVGSPFVKYLSSAAFFNSVFDLFDGISLVTSPDPLTFLHVSSLY